MCQNAQRRQPMTATCPDWVPAPVRTYLAHTECGRSIRGLARQTGCHASTVLRQIRRVEARRDDPLIDAALTSLAARLGRARAAAVASKDSSAMTKHTPHTRAQTAAPDDCTVEREARRILRRLSESHAVLAVAREMEKAVVVRETPDGRTARTAVVDRAVAEAMALKDWIACQQPGRIARYTITAAGRAALKRLLAEDRTAGDRGFAAQHGLYEMREIDDEDGPRQVRYNAAESPLATLARRRGKDGKPFLSAELVTAGERLREDFELAQMGPRVAQNWDRFLTGADRGSFRDTSCGGPADARNRVAAALRALGPGLGDVALRCCCFLEGLETTEKRLGWSARSGKIVLRIALQRLRWHYEETGGRFGPKIG